MGIYLRPEVQYGVYNQKWAEALARHDDAERFQAVPLRRDKAPAANGGCDFVARFIATNSEQGSRADVCGFRRCATCSDNPRAVVDTAPMRVLPRGQREEARA